jgi:PAS domain S-box-containing protein
MDNYFPNQLAQQQGQQRHVPQQGSQQQNSQRTISMSDTPVQPSQPGQPMASMSDTHMIGGDSLDDIIRDNSQELQRRRSIQQPFGPGLAQEQPQRRMSMMEFGATGDAFRDYQFPTSAMSEHFPNLPTNLAMSAQVASFPQQGSVLQMSDVADFEPISPDMMGSMMPETFANMRMGHLGPDPTSMSVFPASAIAPKYPSQTMDTTAAEFSMDMTADPGSLVGSHSRGTDDLLGGDRREDDMIMPSTAQPTLIPTQSGRSENMGAQQHTSITRDLVSVSLPPTHATVSPDISTPSFQTGPRSSSQATPPTTINLTQAGTPSVTTPIGPPTPIDSREKYIYSKSGFDMLKAFWRVANRPSPQIHLGAVDMSCAFVVCDVTMNDCPIIYVSDNFQNLTGYSRHEIMGKNCRFLQAPDAKVEAGSKREFVDDASVFNLKKKIAEGREVQQSLINYRKGGKPFLNLLTMIPIPWDTEEIRYFIGFQIDVVECPDAISSGQDLGGVTVNYKHSEIPQYIWNPPTKSLENESGQTLGVDDVSTLLQKFNPKGIVSDWHKQSWDKMLLENTDDVVHVLSLKGLFLYLSPSCKRVLEYDAAELAGSSLSTVCHPSDIVPVTRELKDTTVGNPVNIVFRIRRKESGYTWFESHGSLFVEQGKGRKCIILVGRKRPVFALSRKDLEANGGIGDSELWTKLSTSGMFLFVSSNIRSLLDLQPETLVGTSIQDLMRKESRQEFGRSIEKARKGKIVSCKHEVQNRRGQVLQAQTTLYPGDAVEGKKPSFLLAQTKLIKASSRAIAPATTPSQAGSTPAATSTVSNPTDTMAASTTSNQILESQRAAGIVAVTNSSVLPTRNQEAALAIDDNIFEELRTTKCSSWQFELRQMEKINRILAEELGGLLSNKKKRKRRKGVGNVVRDCANCHTRNTPEWRRGPSGQRDLCNSCGLRWAKQASGTESTPGKDVVI